MVHAGSPISRLAVLIQLPAKPNELLIAEVFLLGADRI
jgi:hypothetical protein